MSVCTGVHRWRRMVRYVQEEGDGKVCIGGGRW